MFSLLRRLVPQHSFLRKGYSHLSAVVSVFCAGFPARGFAIIAITGTDGKTTVTEMTAHILRFCGKPLLSISTAAIVLGRERLPSTKRTTPSPRMLATLFRKARKSGASTAVLEVSSHALSQGRIFGIQPRVAVLTNITPEHLDYYGTLDTYRLAKKKLFCRALGKSGTAVINLDDPVGPDWAEELTKNGKSVIGYSRSSAAGADLLAEAIEVTSSGIRFTIADARNAEKVPAYLPIAGEYNVQNALAAIAAARAMGCSLRQAVEALRLFTGVAGRMQPIANTEGLQVFVDFALTPAALKSALESAKTLAGSQRVVVVFGSAGNHPDSVVRQETGRIAASLADITIITDDEPYFEDPASIRVQILLGARAAFSAELSAERILEIADRREAIIYAIKTAKKGDVVLVTGMGHLKSRNISGQEMPWSDIDIITEALAERQKA